MIEACSVEELLAGASDVSSIDSAGTSLGGYDHELVWWERRAVEAADLL